MDQVNLGRSGWDIDAELFSLKCLQQFRPAQPMGPDLHFAGGGALKTEQLEGKDNPLQKNSLGPTQRMITMRLLLFL